MRTLDIDRLSVVEIMTGHYLNHPHFTTVRPDGTSDWLLMVTTGGVGRVRCEGGRDLTAMPGDAIMTRPGTMHDYGTVRGRKSWEVIWTHFHPRAEWLALLDWPEESPGLMRIAIGSGDTAAEILAALTEMHTRNTGANRRRSTFAMNALERALLLLDTLNPKSEEASVDARVLIAMDILMKRIGERYSLEPAAEACALSVSRLAHLFAAQTGITPQRYAERERLTRASQELRLTDKPVHAIAAEFGFESPFYFSRRFKLFAGMSPQQFRSTSQSPSASKTRHLP